MGEFFKKQQKKHKAEQEWLNNYRDSLERAKQNIEKHQERKLLTSQVVLLVFIGAFLVNLLTSTTFDLVTSASQMTIVRINWDIGISLASIAALIIVFLLLERQLSKYKPPQPFLSLSVKPEDTSDILGDEVFQAIKEYLEKGKLTDFKLFGDNFFESLSGWFSHMFNDKVSKKPIKEYEEFEQPVYKALPIMIKEYDISPMSLTGVKVNLEVVLAPDIVYSYSEKGDQTASYTFYIVFTFRILNPDNCNAEKFLVEYFHFYAYRLLSISSYCIASAFRKLGLTTTQKQKESLPN